MRLDDVSRVSVTHRDRAVPDSTTEELKSAAAQPMAEAVQPVREKKSAARGAALEPSE
ncbi:MAG TPA: hypothetical protein VFN64_01485 [Burkholderiaceae bacterium]|nr:hypothetical protein [Burkholderiaceae bacterium]